MTKKEITNNRENDLYFSKWIRNKLEDSHTGFRCYDLDFILWHKKNKNIMFIELKSYNAEVKPDQRLMLKLLDQWIKKGITEDWNFYGTHLITFEKSGFENGKCFLNNKEIKEKDLIDFLNFKRK
tara:strand:+ start:216 stop:590 length:375 start_codon:yes stop_codon:yes gene_type:complete